MEMISTDNHNLQLSPTSTGVHPRAESFWMPGGSTGILIIHGYGGSIGDYRELAVDLHQAGFSVRGLRLAGHGRTVEALAQSHMPDWRESVFQAARQLKRDCRQIILFGVSFGGSLALDYAMHGSSQISAVVTVNTPLTYQAFGPLQKLALRIMRLGTPYLKKFGLTEADRKRMIEIGSADRWPINGIFETTKFIQTFVWPGLPRLRVPVLIFRSLDDPYVDPVSAERLLERLGSPSKRVELLPAKNHRPLRDPELRKRVLEVMQEFIGGLAKKA